MADKLNIRQNEVNRKGEKIYSVKCPHLNSVYDVVHIRTKFDGRYKVSWYEGDKKEFDDFKAAADYFHKCTGERPPEPSWRCSN